MRFGRHGHHLADTLAGLSDTAVDQQHFGEQEVGSSFVDRGFCLFKYVCRVPSCNGSLLSLTFVKEEFSEVTIHARYFGLVTNFFENRSCFCLILERLRRFPFEPLHSRFPRHGSAFPASFATPTPP